VLHLLTEIRDSVAAVGKRCETQDTEFTIGQITDLAEFKELESSLVSDEEKTKLFVSL
jgi:hypothetical protein